MENHSGNEVHELNVEKDDQGTEKNLSRVKRERPIKVCLRGKVLKKLGKLNKTVIW